MVKSTKVWALEDKSTDVFIGGLTAA